MAKFRTNHQRKGRGASSVLLRLGILLFLGMVALSAFFLRQNEWVWEVLVPTAPALLPAAERYYLPPADSLEHQSYFSRGLDTLQQVAWVAFRLEAKQIPFAERQAPAISQSDRDCSQLSGFWPPATEVQEACRDYLTDFLPGPCRPVPAYLGFWASQFSEIMVVTGPITRSPGAWYWGILDPIEPEVKGMGLIRDQAQHWTLVSIDSLEVLLQQDLFGNYLIDSLETIVEGNAQASHWAWLVN